MEKNIHQIWIGPYTIPKREKQFVEKVKQIHTDWNHLLWTDENLPDMPDNIREAYDYFGSRRGEYAFQADVLRLFLVYKFGGMYFDVDFEPMDKGILSGNFENYDLVLYHHDSTDYTIPNPFFGCAAGNPLFEYLVSKVDVKTNHWYGPSWMGIEVKKYFGLEYETPHDILNEKIEKMNGKYIIVHEFDKMFRHRALYSWSPQNIPQFEKGNSDYLTEGYI